MRRALGSLLLPALLTGVVALGAAGCGNATDTAAGTAGDTAGGSHRTPSSSSTAGSGPAETVAMISQTNAGGRVNPAPTVLDGPAALASFAGQFHSGAIGARLRQTVSQAHVHAGRALVAAVVAVGCDTPRDVEVDRTADGLEVTAQSSRSSKAECFAPVTTVAVVDVDASLV